MNRPDMSDSSVTFATKNLRSKKKNCICDGFGVRSTYFFNLKQFDWQPFEQLSNQVMNTELFAFVAKFSTFWIET